MDWKTTEEIYAEMIQAEKEAAVYLNEHSAALRAMVEKRKEQAEKLDFHRWKMKEVRELKAELNKRAGI